MFRSLRRLPRVALLALLLLPWMSISGGAADEKPAVRIKVFCQLEDKPGGFVNPELKDALKDVQQAVQKKKDWLELVEAANMADVVVTVIDRRIVPTGEFESSSTASTDKDRRYASGTARTREIKNYVVRASMTVGEYQQDIEGTCRDTYILGGLWRTAAGDVAGQVEKFVKTNYSRLMADKAKRGR